MATGKYALTVDEIIDKGDELIRRFAVMPSELGKPLREYVIAEHARRVQAAEEFRTAPVDVPGGPLVIGEFYDVELQPEFGYGRRGRKTQFRRVCRYQGRDRQGRNEAVRLFFSAWGAKALKADPEDRYVWARGEHFSEGSVVQVIHLKELPANFKQLIERVDREKREQEERAAKLAQALREAEERGE